VPYDFKKELKELYGAKAQPAIVTVPKANFIAIRGQGDPNETGGAYQQAVSVLYAVAYTLRMSYKAGYSIPGFFEYAVPPLEGFWQQEGAAGIDYANKAGFQWLSVIRLPDFVTEADFAWAVGAASEKKKMDCSAAAFTTIDEGLCVQMLHLGPYDSEPETVAQMDAFVKGKGFAHDFSGGRLHHEIYLSDPHKTAPEKCRTIIRHPIKNSSCISGDAVVY